MGFFTAIRHAYGESAGPDELLVTAQCLYDTIDAGHVSSVISRLENVSEGLDEMGVPEKQTFRVNLGSVSGSVSGSVPASVSGSAPGNVSGSVPASVPASVSGSAPGNVSGNVPASVSGSVPASVSGSAPGSVSGSVPASVPASVSGSVPGNVSGSAPGTGSGSIPGSVQGTGSRTAPGNAPRNEALELALRLIILELKLYFLPGATHTEPTLRSLAALSPANGANASVTPLMRLKYQDLLTDYQILLSPTSKYLRLMDLVAKKINALALVQASNPVVANVQLKMMVYYLLSDSDFRDKSISKYLASFWSGQASGTQTIGRDGAAWGGDSLPGGFKLGHVIGRCMANKERVQSYEQFSELVQYAQQSYMFVAVFQKFRPQLTENHLDTNLSKLPRYYSSIKISRIKSLLLYEDADTDVESVVCRMITNNKLPVGTAIDQLAGVVIFGRPAQQHDAFNTHVKRICDLVDRLSCADGRFG